MIQLIIKNEADLYNLYDPTGTRINIEVYNYLKSFCMDVESKKNPPDRLKVISDAPVDSDRLKYAIQYAAKNEQDEYTRQIKENNKRALWGCFVGLALSIAGFILTKLADEILLAIISFFGTMTLREAIVIYTKMNPDIVSLRDRLNPLLDIEIENSLYEESE